jgi:hypothetical protein
MLARRWLRRVLVGLALQAAVACGDDEAPAPAEAGAAPADPGTPWAERVGSHRVAELVAALAQPHAIARAAYGPHRLHTRAVFDLAPPPSEDDVVPALDQPVVAPQHLEDELELRFTAAAGDPPTFALSQKNDHDRGREVVVEGGRVYVKKAHRGWLHYPLESDLYERWLDDGYHAVRDAVELAAPRLSFTTATRQGEGLSGGDAIEVTLSLADAVDASLVSTSPTRTWRADAEIESVRGTILLDAATGLWLSADIDVDYGLAAADGRALAGNLQLTAAIEAGPDAAIDPVKAPADASPLPERARYEAQAERLLDGLGAP